MQSKRQQAAVLHGGDWASYQRVYGADPLDFSASISPLGVPESVRRAIQDAASHADRYPDPRCSELTGRLAQLHDVRPGQVLCGNGAADLIYRVAYALRPKRALVCDPTFAEYERALCQVGCAIHALALDPACAFSLDVDKLIERIVPGIDLLVLCEPNNPTGRTVPRVQLERVLARCAQTKTAVLVDECFNDFLDDPAAHTLVPLLSDYPHLVVLKAFTKLYALAGMRLGYALSSNEGLLGRMAEAGPPWSVSTVAQAAGVAALDAHDYRSQVRALVREERPRLVTGLEAAGCTVVPGEANYLLFFCDNPHLHERLAERGILVRDCSNFRGLEPGWYRVAVRTRADNDRLLAAVREVRAHG